LVYHVTHADALGGAARNLGDLSTWLFLENPIAVTGDYPAVIMERRTQPDGSSRLIEVARHDFLYDAKSGEWRIMFG
jgi:hypothetical protein